MKDDHYLNRNSSPLKCCMHASMNQARLMQESSKLQEACTHARKHLARILQACDFNFMIYLLVNKKGGVGKSTIAASLAVYLHDAGRRVAVLDADEQLHTARAVAECEPAIAVGAQFDPNKIPETILNLKKEHDDVVCDAPARLGDETRALMVMADVAIFPMEPTIKCLRSTKDSIEILNYARTIMNGKPSEAWLVLNKAKKQTRIYKEIEELAPSLGLTVTSAAIRDLQAFPEADQQGTVVLRMKPDTSTIRNAQDDMRSLFEEILLNKEGKVANG